MPDDLKNMEEKRIVMTAISTTEMPIDEIELESSGHIIQPGGFGTEDLLLFNGMYKPTIVLNQGKWYRFRLVMSAANYGVDLAFAAELGCELQLLAKDGVWIPTGH